MRSLPKAILERSRALAEGSVLAPKEFLHLGKRAAVDQAFCRLVKSGQLVRISRGIYSAPIREQERVRAQPAKSVVAAIAAQGKQIVASSGASSALSFGLIREVPGHDEYLTSGRDKLLDIGGQRVDLKHAPYWMLSLGSSPAGDALRAIAWMGEEQADRACKTLSEKLTKDEWDHLVAVRASLPSWMAVAIGKASAPCAAL